MTVTVSSLPGRCRTACIIFLQHKDPGRSYVPGGSEGLFVAGWVDV
jgi:hypothetical protein